MLVFVEFVRVEPDKTLVKSRHEIDVSTYSLNEISNQSEVTKQRELVSIPAPGGSGSRFGVRDWFLRIC
jgi:hypothetical protein